MFLQRVISHYNNDDVEGDDNNDADDDDDDDDDGLYLMRISARASAADC